MNYVRVSAIMQMRYTYGYSFYLPLLFLFKYLIMSFRNYIHTHTDIYKGMLPFTTGIITSVIFYYQFCKTDQPTYREDDEMNHLMRMHLVGAPSAPTNLNGRQWSEYIPTSTSSSFSASTGIIS